MQDGEDRATAKSGACISTCIPTQLTQQEDEIAHAVSEALVTPCNNLTGIGSDSFLTIEIIPKQTRCQKKLGRRSFANPDAGTLPINMSSLPEQGIFSSPAQQPDQAAMSNAQRRDASLHNAWKLTEENGSLFFLNNGLLYRYSID